MTNWKTIAIVFIIIAVLEFVVLIWFWNVGTQYIEREEECAYDICELDELEASNYDSYFYDNVYQMCYCYKDGEIVKQKHI